MLATEKREAALRAKGTGRSLDHFVTLVGDIETGAEMYRRLGFTVMPVMEHLKIGSSNVCIQFLDTYMELIGDFAFANMQLTELEEPWKRFDEYIFWQAAMTSSRLEDTREELAALGLVSKDIMQANRRVRLIGGGWDQTESRSFYTLNRERITGSLFHSDHPRPEALWIPAYQTHPNSAVRVLGLSYLSSDPLVDAEYYGKMVGAEPAEHSPARLAFHTPRGEFLEFVQADRAQDLLPGAAPLQAGLAVRGAAFTIAVEDLARCRMALRSGGVPVREINHCLVTPAAFGAGMAIHFVEEER